MRASARERPRVDHPVDRPELYGARALQVTGTNGQQKVGISSSRIIPGDRGKIGPGWLVRSLENSAAQAGDRRGSIHRFRWQRSRAAR
jgi:hypothetical protein